MTKAKPKPKRAVDAVQLGIARERQRREGDLKPIEIVKAAISSYQGYFASEETDVQAVESDDAAGLRRGTQASVDRLLFNANYWRAAYEERIIAACSNPDDARDCLKAACVWNTHTLKLNSLSPIEVKNTFERFCPPFALNNRRGSGTRAGAGKGPVADFKKQALEIAERETSENAASLRAIVADMEAEAQTYEALGTGEPLDTLYAVLPAWCLQERIELVCGSWWDDCDVMNFVVESLYQCFLSEGYGEALCQYFLDSCREAIDAYQRDIASEPSPFADKSVPELVQLVHEARESHPNYEADGYGEELPAWLADKEQLVWNTVACSIYGPACARPSLGTLPTTFSDASSPSRSDIITELARTSFSRYTADRASSNDDIEFPSFADQPVDLRNSSIEHIRSIPDKLDVLGYEIMPAGSVYPDQRVTAFTPSEVECLAILEHRRWLSERSHAGWTYAGKKDVSKKKSPYLVPWEELPDRAREWNRSAVRNIPELLASADLAIVRK